MLVPVRHYDDEEIKNCIQAIADGREQDITLPIRILRRQMPKEFKKALAKAQRNTDEIREVTKVYNRKYQKEHLEQVKTYSNAKSILMKKHKKEFNNILKELRN
jgi:AmiR/NasT family two-component response regulator